MRVLCSGSFAKWREVPWNLQGGVPGGRRHRGLVGYNKPGTPKARNPKEADMPGHGPNPKKTIEQVLDEFLAEQEARWSPATYRRDETIIDLLKRYMEGYWPGHDSEYEPVTKAGGTYCGPYGPEDIAGVFGMFLDYFLPRKVICGRGTEKAAPAVVRKLAKWLVQKGYDPHAADAVD
jgi:hypothetical protein